MLAEPNVDQRLIAGRRVRWNDQRAQQAYAEGWWVRETLADTLRRAAADAPDRVLIVDGAVRIDSRTLLDQASVLAQAMLARFPTGSVVSFMLPNWHEAAVIYMAATLAGMVVHPVIPSLRDHDLLFSLKDSESRMIFIPAEIRGFDYRAMLGRVAAQLDTPPHIVIVRGEAGSHTPYTSGLKR